MHTCNMIERTEAWEEGSLVALEVVVSSVLWTMTCVIDNGGARCDTWCSLAGQQHLPWVS